MALCTAPSESSHLHPCSHHGSAHRQDEFDFKHVVDEKMRPGGDLTERPGSLRAAKVSMRLDASENVSEKKFSHVGDGLRDCVGGLIVDCRLSAKQIPCRHFDAPVNNSSKKESGTLVGGEEEVRQCCFENLDPRRLPMLCRGEVTQCEKSVFELGVS